MIKKKEACSTKPSSSWTQRDGTTIVVCDMSDEHLAAAIAMCMRNHRKRVRRRALVIAWHAYSYAVDAPDGAAMAANEEADEYMDGRFDEQILAEASPQFAALVEERQARSSRKGSPMYLQRDDSWIPRTIARPLE